jgi:acyl-CoA hydrolase
LNPDVKQAIGAIPDGAHVFLPIAAGASPDAFSALVQRLKTMQRGVDVDIFTNGLSEAELKQATKQYGNKLRLHSLFLGSNLRNLYRDGKVDLVPGNLGDFAREMQAHQNPKYHYDAIIVRVSPPDAQGHYSLGPNHDMIMTVIRNNPGIKVVAEVNPNVPHSTGDNFLTANQITSQFQSQAGPPVVPFEEVEKKIGENLGKLVDNGAYLQVGIGNVFDGLPDGLKQANKSHLKIFSEMYGDALMRVVDTGLADNARVGFAYGSANLYKSLENNPKVTLVPTTEVNDPQAVARMPKFDAINTALQVDLQGNVNATVGPDNKAISSPGGQLEFMSGASRSPGGKAIIALRSTAKNGQFSSIMPTLYNNNITTPSQFVTHVVTEYGTADLAGKTPAQKAIAIIQIAAPRWRSYLMQQAVAQHLITPQEGQQINMVN